MSTIAQHIIKTLDSTFNQTVLGWDGEASKKEALQETANIIYKHSGYKTMYLEINNRLLDVIVDEKDCGSLRVFQTRLFTVDLDSMKEIYGKWRRYLHQDTLVELRKFC